MPWEDGIFAAERNWIFVDYKTMVIGAVLLLFSTPPEFEQLALPSSRMERMIAVHAPTIAATARANVAALLLGVLVQQYHKHTVLSPAVNFPVAVDQRTWRWSIEPNQSLLDVRTLVRYAFVVPGIAILSKTIATNISRAEITHRFVLDTFQILNEFPVHMSRALSDGQELIVIAPPNR